MIDAVCSLSSTKSGSVHSMSLQADIQADKSLPPLSHINTTQAADGSGDVTIVFVGDTALTSAQKRTLDAIVAAHDHATAELAFVKTECHAVVDARTANYKALRAIALMTEKEIDDGGVATKAAVDAAATVEECRAAADADTRPTLTEPIGIGDVLA